MYSSLNSAIYDLRKRGYRLNFFHHQFDFVTCLSIDAKIPFKDFQIDESYSFPSLHEDGVRSVLYALTTPTGLRGILFDFSEEVKDQEKLYLEKLHQETEHKKKQYQFESYGYSETY